MSCKDCDAYCINAGEEDAVSCGSYISKLQTNADSYTCEEAKDRLMSIGVMDENENHIPPYDKIFVKREEE